MILYLWTTETTIGQLHDYKDFTRFWLINTFLPSSGIGLPRSAYARLAAAGFPHILDRNGEPPEVIDPGDPIEFEMGKEERDRLPANEIILQFLAFSRSVQG